MWQYASPTRESWSEYGENSPREGHIALNPHTGRAHLTEHQQTQTTVGHPHSPPELYRSQSHDILAQTRGAHRAGVHKTACSPGDAEPTWWTSSASQHHSLACLTQRKPLGGPPTTCLLPSQDLDPALPPPRPPPGPPPHSGNLSRVGRHHYQTTHSNPQGGKTAGACILLSETSAMWNSG